MNKRARQYSFDWMHSHKVADLAGFLGRLAQKQGAALDGCPIVGRFAALKISYPL
jgi:hypothetical protein